MDQRAQRASAVPSAQQGEGGAGAVELAVEAACPAEGELLPDRSADCDHASPPSRDRPYTAFGFGAACCAAKVSAGRRAAGIAASTASSLISSPPSTITVADRLGRPLAGQRCPVRRGFGGERLFSHRQLGSHGQAGLARRRRQSAESPEDARRSPSPANNSQPLS